MAPGRRERWLAYVIGAFGLGIGQQINFLVPLRAREMGASFEVVGVIVAAAALAPAVLSVPLGAITDRFGARTTFIWSALLTAATALLAVTIHDYWWLLALQFVLGTVRTGGWIASQSYITSLGRLSERASFTGRFSFFSNLGSTLGPLGAGAAAQIWGFRLAFVFLAAYSLTFVIIALFLPRVDVGLARKPGSGSGFGFRGATTLLGLRGIRVAMMLTGTRLWMSWAFASFFPLLLVEGGLSAGIAGSVVGFAGFIAMVMAPTAGFWCRWRTPEVVAAIGLGGGGLGLMVAPFLTSVPWVYLTPLLVGIGTGLSLPLLLTIVTQAAPPQQRATALGLRQAVNNLAGAAAPLVIGPLITVAGMTLAFGATGGLAVTVLLWAGFLSQQQPDEATSGDDDG